MNKPRTLLPIFFFAFALAHDHHSVPDKESGHERERQIHFFEQRLERNALDTMALTKLGLFTLDRARVSGMHADYARAEAYFRDMLTIDDSDVTGRLGLSRALLGQHRFHEALDHARIAGELKPKRNDTRALIGDIHFALGNYLEAEVMFHALEGQGTDLPLLARLAQIAEVRGRLAETEQCYNEALAAGLRENLPAGQISWCHTMLGDLMLKTGRLPAAREHFNAAIEAVGSLAYASWRLAEIDELEGKPLTAMERLHALLHEGDAKPAYAFAFARLKRAAGESQVADRWFTRAEGEILAEIERGELGHIRELVMAWLQTGKNPQRAYELARRDLEEVRHDSEAYELVGWTLHLLGRDAEAAGYMDAALRPGLGNARTLLRAGIVAYAADHKIRAAHLLRIGRSCEQNVDAALYAEADRLAMDLRRNPIQLQGLLNRSKRPGRAD